MVDEYVGQIISSMNSQKDEEIKKAISYKIGHDNWTIEEVTGRGEFKIFPDKTEIFAFDDVDLLHFEPIEIETENKSIGITLRTKQNFKRLYKI